MPPYCTSLGTPTLLHRSWSYSAVSTPWRVARRRGPGLITEINNENRGLHAPQGLKSVTVVIHVCAELLRFSRKNKRKDWIDGGSFLLYHLRVGYVAQSGPLSHLPFVDRVMRRVVLPLLQQLRVNVSYALPKAHRGLF